ncbi:MAG: erythromycin esterase family protein [Candidatus Cyclonatronum sp.]|uniref:erythromycin esterase family protein n=1 Tax=Cyclonatronum sp. TaxID=3024185 RepID=UPI0025BA1D59|nr:erythromycin esterase family protein [Cyclonatronum sp.]MCH8487827.1 erythromycin esterase family protein [Cyclonatronum sp.]
MSHQSHKLFLFFVLLLLFFPLGISGVGLSTNTSDEGVSSQAERSAELFLSFSEESLPAIASKAAGRRAVLLGESTHGTSEYYRLRAALSKILIEEHGYNFIAVEGDWDAAWQVNKYIKQLPGAPASAREALGHFTRWPFWLWNNVETLELVEWLRARNDALPEGAQKVGFYGIDVYGWPESVRFLREQSDRFEGELRTSMRVATQCINRFRGDSRAYLQTVANTGEHCGRDILELVQQLENTARPDDFSEDAWLNLMQHAQVFRQADLHLRGMLFRGPQSWNERAANFKQTFARLLDFYGEEARGIGWAHNTHIGDARATDMGSAGMHNIGQLTRTAFGDEEVFALGFGTFSGSVNVGFEWEGPMQVVEMPDAQPGSLEAGLYSLGMGALWFPTRTDAARDIFSSTVPHRAVGVVYNPENDAVQNYVNTDLPRRYDAFLFLPYTQALTPLR